MSKFEKIMSLLEVVFLGIVSVGTLVTLVQMHLDAQKNLIAVVECVYWKAPQTVVTDLKVMEINKITAMGPDRMTAEDACNTRSLYVVKIHNKAENVTENAKIAIPTALYWEVYYKTEESQKRPTSYVGRELISLPGIQSGTEVDVKVWASCDTTRSHAKEILITQDHGPPALLELKTPVRASAQLLNQNIRIVLILIFVGIGLVAIMRLTRRYLRHRQQ